MDLSKVTKVALKSSTLDGLKTELEDHLTVAMQRQPKTVTLTSYKIPIGLGGVIEPGQRISSVIPFAVNGNLTDFMSSLPASIKDVYIHVTVRTGGVSQTVDQRLQDGFRSYDINLAVPKMSFAKVELENKGKTPIEALVGFTFEERLANEIKAPGLIGTI